MTPAELAKVSKSARNLGFTNQEIDACNGDQLALLALFASSVSEISIQAGSLMYGAKKANGKTLKDVDDEITKKTAKAVKVK